MTRDPGERGLDGGIATFAISNVANAGGMAFSEQYLV